jgi:IgA-specific serine endopeptidase
VRSGGSAAAARGGSARDAVLHMELAGEAKRPVVVVRAPWATVDDEALGVKARAAAGRAAEQYLLQAPWTKAGADEKSEMARVREALDVRQARRAENAQRERALRELSKDDNEDAVARARRWRAERSAEAEAASRAASRQREGEITGSAESLCKLASERKQQEKEERARAQEEARVGAERKRALLAREKREVLEEREHSVQQSVELCDKTSKLQGERRLEAVAYKAVLASESFAKRRASAELLHEEREQRERAEREIRREHQGKQSVRAAWMMEEKTEEGFRLEQQLRERAGARASRAASLDIDREAARQAAERLAADGAELRAVKGELGAAQRRAAELEHRSKRDEVLSHMESQHLRAVERKRREQQAFEERNTQPLERLKQFTAQRKVAEKEAAASRRAEEDKEMIARAQRRRDNYSRERELRKSHVAFG